MRGRFKWIWLVLGVLLITGTCGFGYEAKRNLTQYEEAKDAFSKQDWQRVVANLSETSDAGRPKPKAFVSFLQTYVDPVLAKGQYKLISKETNSSMVPVKNEVVSYQDTETPRLTVATLRYLDDAAWFEVPFSTKKFGIFRGKLINMSFAMCFYRVCWANYPQPNRRDSWKSILSFIDSEKGKLTEMGITPKNLYSKKATWDEYAEDYRARVAKWLDDQRKLVPLESGLSQTIPRQIPTKP